MFVQDHDFPDDVSEGEIEAEAGNESSDDDDLKRVLRHIGGLDENVADEDDFEKSMEDELDNTIKSLEKNRGPQTDPTFISLNSYALSEHSAKSLLLAPGGSSTIAASSSSGPPVSRSEIKPKKAVQFMEKPAEFYDDIYFDSDDEERESSLKQNGTRAAKKHPVLSNDDLFYDPKVDDEDQRWVEGQRRKYQPKPSIPIDVEDSACSPSASPSKRKSKEKPVPTTDAVLNCPACMTTICLDCQRHEVYQQQYRAMFVLNCIVDKTRSLICKAKKQQQKKRRMTDSEPDEFVPIDSGATGLTAKEDTFHPVKCVECNTEVGVIDSEEVYHFFNVIASHP